MPAGLLEKPKKCRSPLFLRTGAFLHNPRQQDDNFQAKAGTGSATLSMAYAAVKFADACLHGWRGDAGIVECAFVASRVIELPFFASKVRLGRIAAEEVLPLVH